MMISRPALDAIYTGFKTNYNSGFSAATVHWQKVAMLTTSSTGKEAYPFLGQAPGIREWIGDRIVNQLAVHGFTIENRMFELTLSVKRTEIEDDTYGVYGKAFEMMGYNTAKHPDELIFPLLRRGFDLECYDGQNFFDADHPYEKDDGSTGVQSNVQAGSSLAWFLLDTTKPLRPMIFQKRKDYEFQRLDGSSDDHVFWRDEYIYGVRARVNAGYGVYHSAFGSKAELNADNFEAASVAMQMMRGDRGKLLGVKPTLLVVPPQLERKARELIKATSTGGETNIWHQAVDVLVEPLVYDV